MIVVESYSWGTLSNSVTMGSVYGLYFTDFAGHATNGYYEVV